MASDKKDLLLLFQKPSEPIFTKKDKGKTAFEVPSEYLTDRYKTIGAELQTRFGEDVDKKVTIKPITPPNLSFASALMEKSSTFSLFNQKHKEIASQLIKIFMDQRDPSSFLSVAAYVKDRLNPLLFQYSLTVATQHRDDTKDLMVPSIVQNFPDRFVGASIFPRAREEGTLVPEGERMFINIPLNYTATEREPEQRMAYFREDIGVNVHHWHWHLVYPGEGEDRIINKDRRGELFYYMHSQLIARYNVERFDNRLGRVRPLSNFRESLGDAYFPKIIRSSNNQAYPPRFNNAKLMDINRPEDGVTVQVSDMERWRDRILEAIDQGFVLNRAGKQIPLDEARGIDILGNIVEASGLSPNRKLYGNLHNEGHNIIAYVHDPDGRYLEGFGVIGDVTTAMRDPAFYRWHAFIEQVFVKYKESLSPYNVSNHLAFEGVTVKSIEVQITRGKKPSPNVLLTYWQKSEVDLATGLDFGPEGNVFAQFTHLQHAPFEYRISVNNDSRMPRQGTCRIFFCPRVDDRGVNLRFKDQRSLLVEMDKFMVTLNPGTNSIRRRSDQSSVTIPTDRLLRSQAQPTNPTDNTNFQICGCGWPQHLLISKGTPEGSVYDIFVMISDFTFDSVNQRVDQNLACNDAASFCGLKDRLYPDRRSMGYPFDRPSKVSSLADFAKQSSNMKLGQCTIRFTNQVINRT